MKHPCYLLLCVLLLISCASKTLNSAHQREIAFATQRLGEEYYNTGNYTAALKNLLEAQETIPNDPYLHDSLGLVYLARQRYDLAEHHFKTAITLKPDYVLAKNNLGATYLKQKKWALAIQCFEAISGNLLYATPEVPLSNLGWAYFHQKMFKKAKQYFIESLDIRPGFLIAIHGLASVYIQTGAYTQSLDFLRHELTKNPGAAILHSDLAKTYDVLKDFDNAIRSWNVVLELVPETSSLAKEAQKRLFELN